MLELYCNLIEFMRLRHELIMTTSETEVLKTVYHAQCKLCNASNIKCEFSDSVSFEAADTMDQQKEPLINYFDEGPGSHLEFGLTIKEFDRNLLSTMNFRNPDSIKLCVTSAGLEELRAVLAYQLMQKHLLIIGTRMN